MSEQDLEIRNHINHRFVETQRAPRTQDLGADWRPRSPDEAQGILDSLGLTGPFWRFR